MADQPTKKRQRRACLGAPTISVRTTEYMERCQACGTEVQYQLVDHPFWGFRAGCVYRQSGEHHRRR